MIWVGSALGNSAVFEHWIFSAQLVTEMKLASRSRMLTPRADYFLGQKGIPPLQEGK